MKGNLSKGNIKVITREYAMHSYGIRLCVIEIKISNIQVNASLNKEIRHCNNISM